MPKKKTHEDFIKQVNEKFYQVEVLGKYYNNKTPINFKCKIHNYTWEGYPRTLLMSECGCPKCGIELRANNKRKTHEAFVKEIKSINKNIEILSKYTKSNEYVKCKCKIDGYEWSAVPSGLLRGNGCPKCGIEKVQAPRRRTQEQFIEQLHDINPNIELTSSYIGSHNKISVKCNICNYEWTTFPGSLLYKKIKCPQCIGETITPSYYKKIVYDLVGDEYDVISDYVDANTQIQYKHNLCGCEFSMKPSSFKKSGSKCGNPFCKREYYIRDSKPKFIEDFYNIHSDEYELKSEYIGSMKPIDILHKKCGNSFSIQKACKSLNKEICPYCTCNKSKGEAIIIGILDKYNKEYVYQQKYPTLLGLGNGELSYDFYLPDNNLLIEYQGEQHYKPIEIFGGEAQFKVQQEHDKRKRQYAKDNSINLLEISYLDFNNIEKILLKELQISA